MADGGDGVGGAIVGDAAGDSEGTGGRCAIVWITAVRWHYGDVAAVDFVVERLAAGGDS